MINIRNIESVLRIEPLTPRKQKIKQKKEFLLELLTKK